jgi:hypothetical protein
MRRIVLLLALVTCSMAFAACGGGEDKGGILSGRNAPGATEAPAGLTPSALIPTPGGRTSTPAAQPTPSGNNADREPWQAAMLNASPSLPGEYIPPHPGADGKVCDVKSCISSMDDRNHVNGTIPNCTSAQQRSNDFTNPLCYNTSPPTSGPHSPQFAQNRVYDAPVPKEQLVHSMEHGAVVVWYNTTDQNVIRSMAQIVSGANQSGKMVVMAPYSNVGATDLIAFTSWTRMSKVTVSQYKDQTLLDFINAHSKRFNPEGF